MKLFLILSTFIFGWMTSSTNVEKAPVIDPILQAEIIQSDGTILTFEGKASESEAFFSSIEDAETCTLTTPNGECTQTGATCNEISNEFADCLCDLGYEGWCNGSPIQF